MGSTPTFMVAGVRAAEVVTDCAGADVVALGVELDELPQAAAISPSDAITDAPAMLRTNLRFGFI